VSVWWRRLAGGVLAVVMVTGVSACGSDVPKPDNPVLQPGKPGEPNKSLSPDDAASAAPSLKPNGADVAYVHDMIAHHGQALEITGLVATRGRNEQVKGLALRIADAQGPEIGAMNRWLSANFQPPADHGHDKESAMPGMASPEQLAALTSASGDDFDRQFLRVMINHHRGAVEMANKVQRAGVDVKVQEMADHVIAEQGDEARRMQTMLTTLGG
jgi:uncharacterized protein (DUF305 family)